MLKYTASLSGCNQQTVCCDIRETYIVHSAGCLHKQKSLLTMIHLFGDRFRQSVNDFPIHGRHF